MEKEQQKQTKRTTKRWEEEKENKFHGIFLALLLRKIVLFMSLRYTKLLYSLLRLSRYFFHFSSNIFILENNVFCVNSRSSKIYIGFHFIFSSRSLLQYSGTNAEFTKADTVIFRTDIYNLTSGRKEYNFKRTLKYDSKWLDSKFSQQSFAVG